MLVCRRVQFRFRLQDLDPCHQLSEVLIRGDYTVDQFVDVVLGNRKYVRCLYVYNKADAIAIEEVDRLARQVDWR